MPFLSGVLQTLLNAGLVDLNRMFNMGHDACGTQRLSWFTLLSATNVGINVSLSSLDVIYSTHNPPTQYFYFQVCLGVVTWPKCRINHLLCDSITYRIFDEERILLKMLKHPNFDHQRVYTSSLYYLAINGSRGKSHRRMYNCLEKMNIPLEVYQQFEVFEKIINLQTGPLDASREPCILDKCIRAFVIKGSNKRFVLLERFVKSCTEFPRRMTAIRKHNVAHLVPGYTKRCARVIRLLSRNEQNFDLMQLKF